MLNRSSIMVLRAEATLTQYEGYLKDCYKDLQEMYDSLDNEGFDSWVTTADLEQVEQAIANIEQVIKALNWILYSN